MGWIGGERGKGYWNCVEMDGERSRGEIGPSASAMDRRPTILLFIVGAALSAQGQNRLLTLLGCLWASHAVEIVRVLVGMDLSDDERDPWEREEPDETMGFEDPNQMEEELGPPDEEPMGDEQDEQQEGQNPTALEPAASSDCGPSAVPMQPPLLPVVEPECKTPEKRAHEEPTALTPPALVAKVMAQGPTLKRLKKKTTVPESVCPKVVDPWIDFTTQKFEHQEDFISQKDFAKLDYEKQYNWVYERLRSFYTRHVHARSLNREEQKEWSKMSGQERQKEGRRAFRGLDGQQRAQVTGAWRKATLPPPHIARVCEERFMKDGARTSCRVKGKGVLLTWMLPAVFNAVKPVVGGEEPTALRDVVRLCRASAEVQSTWKDLLMHAQVCKRLAGGSDVAVCLEICPDTWTERQELKLHVHAFIKSNASDVRIKDLGGFSFAGVVPFTAGSIGGVNIGGNGRSAWSGFLYCSISEKVGTVFSEATKVPFKGFLVNPTWILNLVQARKLDMDVAKALLVQCANASRHIRELEMNDVHLEEQAVKREQERAHRLLASSLKPQKTYEKVNEFLRQFETPLHRYKFLVLSGPSRVGKTAFARSLCATGMEVLELNCASGKEPELRAYRLSKHDLILYDEIVASQVAEQRKLFQAQSASVQLGCSATNCHSYGVFVWRKKMVLASNNWESSLEHLTAADREWVDANSIVLAVTEPMWQE